MHARHHPILQVSVTVFPLLVRYAFSAGNVQLLASAGKAMKDVAVFAHGQQFYGLAKPYSWPALDLLLPFKTTKPKATVKELIVDSNYFKVNCYFSRSVLRKLIYFLCLEQPR